MLYDFSKETEIKKAQERFNFLINKKAFVNLSEKRKKRTIKQNAYLHVLFALFGIEVGYTLLEAKFEIKKQLGYFYEKNGTEFPEQTSKMDTKKLTIFIEKFRKFSSEQGYYLPTANEYLFGQSEYDREILKFEKYL